MVFRAFVAASLICSSALAGPAADELGHSLFDQLYSVQTSQGVRYELPDSFAELVTDLQGRVVPKSDGSSSLRGVMFPLGRSLQRFNPVDLSERVSDFASLRTQFEQLKFGWNLLELFSLDQARSTQFQQRIGAFFKYPRLVLAVDGEPAPGQPLLEKRLFFGFQPRTKTLEVISYNDIAGRFEFQIVRDFQATGRKTVVYPNRQLCLGCHQNEAPIFADGEWQESNANPTLQTALLNWLPQAAEQAAHWRSGTAGQSFFYNLPVRIEQDVPRRFDELTNQANLFSVYQGLWKLGCSEGAKNGCRAELIRRALLLRLQAQDEGELRAQLENQASGFGWSGAIVSALPNADVPFRDAGAETRQWDFDWEAHSNMPVAEFINYISTTKSAFAQRRAVVPSQAFDIAKLVAGISQDFLTTTDVQVIAEAVVAQATARENIEGECRLIFAADQTQIDVTGCASPLDFLGGQYRVANLQETSAGSDVRRLSFAVVNSSILPVFGSQLRAVEHISAIRDTRSFPYYRLRVTLKRTDLVFNQVFAALADKSSMQSDVFRQRTIMRDLGEVLGIDDFAFSEAPTPEKVFENGPTEFEADPSENPVFGVVRRNCAGCHSGPESARPFVSDDNSRLLRNLISCAPRIYTRLRVWEVAESGDRVVGGMPANRRMGERDERGRSVEQGRQDEEILKSFLEQVIRDSEDPYLRELANGPLLRRDSADYFRKPQAGRQVVPYATLPCGW